MRREPGRFEAVEAQSGPLGDMRAVSTTGTGTEITTTPQVIRFPSGTKHVSLSPRNFLTAVAVQLSPCPYLSIFKTEDDGATFIDYSEAAQDGDAATDIVLSDLDTLANEHYVHVGAHRPWRGLDVDVDTANSNASVLTVKYWTGTGWADISATDGTDSGGATFAQDGEITWTVPAGHVWKKSTINGRTLYWLRLEVSAALDSSTTQNSIMPLGTSTAYWDLVTDINRDFRVDRGITGWSGIEVRTDAGTASLIVNVASGERVF